jgi:hypothetical protein
MICAACLSSPKTYHLAIIDSSIITYLLPPMICSPVCLVSVASGRVSVRLLAVGGAASGKKLRPALQQQQQQQQQRQKQS